MTDPLDVDPDTATEKKDITIDPDLLRLLGRKELIKWLRSLAMSLENAPKLRGIEMTPFRQVTVERIREAAALMETMDRMLEDSLKQIRHLKNQRDATRRDWVREVEVLKFEIETLKGEEGR